LFFIEHSRAAKFAIVQRQQVEDAKMTDQIINDDGKERIVREDTAKAFRWNKFIGLIFVGFIVLLIVFILFFSGTFSVVRPNLSPSNGQANQTSDQR
jgi:hypothetical protein